MSEIKVRQYWLEVYNIDDGGDEDIFRAETKPFQSDNPEDIVHVLEAEPVLKLLREMGEALALKQVGHPVDVFPVLGKFESFLASIDKGEL